MSLKKINFKQPKFMLPAILYPILLITGYTIIDLFNTKPLEGTSSLETTEYLNSKLPEANYRGDGIGDKASNMRKEWGNVTDFSAMSDIERDSITKNNEYESRYTDEDLAQLAETDAEQAAELARVQQLQQKLAQEMKEEDAAIMNQGTTDFASETERQRAEIEELTKALAEAALLRDETSGAEVTTNIGASDNRQTAVEVESVEETAVTEITEDTPTETVVKAKPEKSDYFSTIAENTPQSNLIKAIIDEDIKCVDGSRVRLRLLDDIEINGSVIKKGTCMYATVSGFGSQRVKGRVQSILVDDSLFKINLSIYDSDGLEGLYVPQSQFRETAKNVASGSLQGTGSLTSSSSSSDNFGRWGMQSLQNAISQTSAALSKSIRQNSAKLKYGTFVYLVNGSQR